MFKKENATTIIFIVVMIGFISLAIFGSFADNDSTKVTKNKTDMTFDISKQPLLGNANAPIQFMEFGDYSCPHCKTWDEEIFPVIKTQLIDKGIANYQFINFQFMNDASILAGASTEYIYDNHSESVWEYHHKLYETSPILSVNKFKEIATEVVPNIDIDKFEASIKNQDYIDHVLSDNEYANEKGVKSTPTLFINGNKVENPFDLEEINSIIMSIQEEKGENDEVSIEE